MGNLKEGDKSVRNNIPQDDAQRQKIQQQLDEALDGSFPASDPVSIVTSHEEEDWGEPRDKPAAGKETGA